MIIIPYNLTYYWICAPL